MQQILETLHKRSNKWLGYFKLGNYIFEYERIISILTNFIIFFRINLQRLLFSPGAF